MGGGRFRTRGAARRARRTGTLRGDRRSATQPPDSRAGVRRASGGWRHRLPATATGGDPSRLAGTGDGGRPGVALAAAQVPGPVARALVATQVSAPRRVAGVLAEPVDPPRPAAGRRAGGGVPPAAPAACAGSPAVRRPPRPGAAPGGRGGAAPDPVLHRQQHPGHPLGQLGQPRTLRQPRRRTDARPCRRSTRGPSAGRLRARPGHGPLVESLASCAQ
ncbi:Uncharacterised protein [Pseudomonas aeruginosa]|nr:Uncharacterised protein [Pseudomonas aeruginosa]